MLAYEQTYEDGQGTWRKVQAIKGKDGEINFEIFAKQGNIINAEKIKRILAST